MQPRKQTIRVTNENEQVAKQREAALDLWLRGLQAPYFHPNVIFNPVDALSPEQDPFKHKNFDAKQQALSVSQHAPVSTTSNHFEPAKPTDVSQLSSQLKRRLQPQKIAITDPFNRSMNQHGTVISAHSNHPVNVPPQQVAFEPDPDAHQFKKPYVIKQSDVSVKPLHMFIQQADALGMSASMPSIQSSFLAKSLLSKKETKTTKTTKKVTMYYFLDGTPVDSSYEIKTASQYFYVKTDNGERLVYSQKSRDSIHLYFEDGSELLDSQYSAVIDAISVAAINNIRIKRTIEIDGKSWPVYTMGELNKRNKKSKESESSPEIVENDPYKSQGKLSSWSILSSSKDMDSSLPTSNAFEPDPNPPHTTPTPQSIFTTTSVTVERNAMQSNFEPPQVNDENDDEAWKRFLL